MKRSTKRLTTIVVAASLAGGAALATSTPATNGGGDYPCEVRTASIKLPRGAKKGDLVRLAKVSKTQAEAVALAALPGEVVRAKLDDENGYLIWQVDVRQAQGVAEVKVDAGNGQVVAIDHDEDDEDAAKPAGKR